MVATVAQLRPKRMVSISSRGSEGWISRGSLTAIDTLRSRKLL